MARINEFHESEHRGCYADAITGRTAPRDPDDPVIRYDS